MLGILSDEQIEQVLLSQAVGRIGCSNQDETYVVPVTYAYHKGYIYAHSREGHKITMMRKNPKVCFEVDAIDNMVNWRCVIISGTYEELKTDKEHRAGMKILIDRFSPITTSATVKASAPHSHPPQVVEKGMKAVVYRIRIMSKTGRYEKPSVS
jgi:uncharacterized protein